MSFWPRRLSPLVVILYAALIVWIFSLEFAGTQRVSGLNGELEFSAWRFPENEYRDEFLAGVNLETGWFQISLRPGRSVVARGSNGSRTPLRAEEVTRTESGYRVSFERGLQIDAINEPGEDRAVQIALIIGEDNNDIQSVELPLEPVDDAEFGRTHNSPMIAIHTSGGTHALSLPDGVGYDGVNRRMTVPGEPGTYTMRSTYREELDEGVLDSWFTARSGTVVSESDVTEAIDDFLEQSWSGWRTELYSSETGTWVRPDGGRRFEERIALALLAEAWERGVYTRVASQMRNARGMHRHNTSYRIAPYLGDLEAYADEMIEELDDKISTIRAMVADGNPEVFELDDRWSGLSVFDFVKTHGGETLLSDLLDFAEEVEPTELEFSTLLSLYEARYFFDGTEVDGLEDSLGDLEDAVVPAIVERVRNTENGFFVETREDTSDVLESLRTGVVLRLMDTEDERIQHLGQRLVYDALELSRNEYSLPRRLDLEGSSIVGSSGDLPAIELYPFLHDNPRLPRFVSPPEPFPEEGFIWTIAELSDIQVNENSISMQVGSPANRTHYLYVHGMESLSRAELFGLENWRDDPNFEQYIRGRYYDPNTSTLMVKWTEDTTQRGMALYF